MIVRGLNALKSHKMNRMPCTQMERMQGGSERASHLIKGNSVTFWHVTAIITIAAQTQTAAHRYISFAKNLLIMLKKSTKQFISSSLLTSQWREPNKKVNGTFSARKWQHFGIMSLLFLSLSLSLSEKIDSLLLLRKIFYWLPVGNGDAVTVAQNFTMIQLI